MRLLFVDVAVLSPASTLAAGYVSVKDGVVEDVGEGEPPLELRAAELIGGGHGRLVLPGFVALVTPTLYPFRGLGLHGLSFEEALSYEEAYYAALMAFYELSVSGYPAVMAVTTRVSPVADAMEASGVSGALLVPFGPGYPKPTREDLEKAEALNESGRVRVYAMRCGGQAPQGLPAVNCMEPGRWVGSPWIELCRLGEEAALERLVESWRMLGYGAPISKGSRANLVVLDLSEPPAWSPGPVGWDWITGSTPRVEMVVADGRPVVDGGQHLYIGLSDCEKARRILSEALSRVKNAGR